ncbi:hypothetical protein ID866_10007 [Astraeus odoratus]|nr:hypothetical protein ID866_10007 [Astraeus odoratus]
MLSPRSLLSVLLALSCVNTSPTHLDTANVTFARASDPKPLHNNQLGKRDGTLIVQRDDSGYYCAYIVTSSLSRFKLAVDTGSAYTWVGARQHNPYVQGFASRATGVPAVIKYGGGLVTFKGETYNDTIALGAVIVNHQGIGVPTEVNGLAASIDGILGLGPTAQTEGTSSDGRLIPTVMDNLYSQGAISSPSLGIYFTPSGVGGVGLLSFGHIDRTMLRLTSDVQYVPVTKFFGSENYFWSVEATIMYGDSMPILDLAPGMVDTGSPWISIASAAFSNYATATGGILHPPGQLTITQDQYNNLQVLYFVIGGQSYHLSPNAQIHPRPSESSSSNSEFWLAVQVTEPGFPLAFSLGVPFFQRYYVVLNSGSYEIGFASHIYTDSTTN